MQILKNFVIFIRSGALVLRVRFLYNLGKVIIKKLRY